MPSTRIGVRDKKDLKGEIQALFGRCYGATACPIEASEIAGLYNNMIPEAYHKVVGMMSSRGYSCDAWFSQQTEFTSGGYKYHLHSAIPLEPPAGAGGGYLTGYFMKLPDGLRGGGGTEIHPLELERAFGARYGDLVSWARNHSMLVEECSAAFVTFDEILDMVSTVGQLKRMVPELVQFLSPTKREMLENQVRSSSVPYEWSGYDRASVRAMMLAMSKCWMMPPSDALIGDLPPSWAWRLGPV